MELINCCVTIGLPHAVSPPIASRELPRFHPKPICCENSTALNPPDDELELDELLVELVLELEDEVELVDELDEELEELDVPQLDTTPPSPH